MFLEDQARQGEPDAILELESLPALPDYGGYLWGHFLALHATRQHREAGPSRLSRLEIRLWEADEGVSLQRWERRAIMAVDAAWVRISAESMAAQTSKQGA